MPVRRDIAPGRSLLADSANLSPSPSPSHRDRTAAGACHQDAGPSGHGSEGVRAEASMVRPIESTNAAIAPSHGLDPVASSASIPAADRADLSIGRSYSPPTDTLEYTHPHPTSNLPHSTASTVSFSAPLSPTGDPFVRLHREARPEPHAAEKRTKRPAPNHLDHRPALPPPPPPPLAVSPLPSGSSSGPSRSPRMVRSPSSGRASPSGSGGIGKGRMDPDEHWHSEGEGRPQKAQGLPGPAGRRTGYSASAASSSASDGAGFSSGYQSHREGHHQEGGVFAAVAMGTHPPDINPPVLAPVNSTLRTLSPVDATGSLVQQTVDDLNEEASVARHAEPVAALTSGAADDSSGELPCQPTAAAILARVWPLLACPAVPCVSGTAPPAIPLAAATTLSQAPSPNRATRTRADGARMMKNPITLGCGHSACAGCLGFIKGASGSSALSRCSKELNQQGSSGSSASGSVNGGGSSGGLMGIFRRNSSVPALVATPAMTSPSAGPGIDSSDRPNPGYPGSSWRLASGAGSNTGALTPGGGLFSQSVGTSLPAPTPTHPLAARPLCLEPTCGTKSRSAASATGIAPSVDFTLQKILLLLQGDGAEYGRKVQLGDGEEQDGGTVGPLSADSWHKSESSDLSSSPTGDVPLGQDSAKRGHDAGKWKEKKRTRRSNSAIEADLNNDRPQALRARGASLPTADASPAFPADGRDGGRWPERSSAADDSSPSGRVPPAEHSTLVQDLLSELECQVCMMLFHEPITAPCGHTFCRNCLTRSLDHSDKCPLCRYDFPHYQYFQDHPCNATINRLLEGLFPDLVKERREMLARDTLDSALNTPIFVCTLAFPNIPTFLHVFEPRYRLMMRRVMATDRRFGMVLPSRNSGGVHEYGTMLEIRNIQLLPDGRSMVETMGVGRFRILDHGTMDGYTVARVQEIVDIPPDQEAELEMVALSGHATTLSRWGIGSDGSPTDSEGQTGASGRPEATTDDLMRQCREFVDVLRSGSTPWILQRLNNTFGPMPANPSDFSYWMAMILPMADEQKALLLPITSYRLRLRLIVHWIETFRSQWWFRGCMIA